MSRTLRLRKHSELVLTGLFTLFLVLGEAPARAHGRALPGTPAAGARVLVYRYRHGRIYTVRTLAGAITDIALRPGEHPLVFALGDTVRWIVARDAEDIFVKPVRAGLETSATLITNKHRYELLLASVSRGSPWDQEVRWRIPRPLVVFERPVPPPIHPSPPPPSPRIDTRFLIRGRARWRPREVYAIGHRTYFMFRRHAASLPALFLLTHGHAQLVDYAVVGRSIIYPGLFRQAVLVLGHRRVEVLRLR